MEWSFRSSSSRVDVGLTALLGAMGVVCRSLHDRAGRRCVPRVADVAPGDLVSAYYVVGGKVRYRKLFEVVLPELHQSPGAFGWRVGRTALWTVTDPTIVKLLGDRGPRGDGFAPDSRLGAFTAWPVRALGAPPPYDGTPFRGRQSLVAFERVAEVTDHAAE